VVAFVAPPVPAPRNLRRISQFVNATQAPALIVQVAAAGGFDDPTINAELEVRLHRNQLGTTGRLVAVGCGAGGRAALAFAAVMEADAAIAFSPSGLPANVDWERAYVVTDPAAAAAYQTNPIFEAMASRIVPAYLLDDSGIDLIAETSSVTALLALAAERASPAALRRLLRGCRAGSASYWRALSTHLRAKAPRWSVARHGALERAYRLQPADLETMIVLADSLLENGRRDQALPLLDNLWERAGEVPAPQLIWRLFMAAGQFARARDVSWQAVHERPLDPMPRLNLARALARMSQIEAAMTQLDLAREYAGNNRQVLTQIRQVQERLGKAGAAVPAGSAAGRHE